MRTKQVVMEKIQADLIIKEDSETDLYQYQGPLALFEKNTLCSIKNGTGAGITSSYVYGDRSEPN